MRSRRLLFYLLLNALVSACATGSILFFYDRHNRATCLPTLPAAMNAITPLSSLDEQVDILAVIGAGAVATEVVIIKNTGAQAIDLDGWTLRDTDKAVYTFPAITVYPEGVIQVHTTSGTNSPVDLYWNRTTAVWETGDIVSLFDSQGALRAVYTIP